MGEEAIELRKLRCIKQVRDIVVCHWVNPCALVAGQGARAEERRMTQIHFDMRLFVLSAVPSANGFERHFEGVTPTRLASSKRRSYD